MFQRSSTYIMSTKEGMPRMMTRMYLSLSIAKVCLKVCQLCTGKEVLQLKKLIALTRRCLFGS